MFCLRSWLPLLFIPTNASPFFVLTFFFLTYFLNRPCVYCSALLVILFSSSCYWSDSCYFDFKGGFFEPRNLPSPIPNPLDRQGLDNSGFLSEPSSMLLTAVNQTVVALANVAVDEVKRIITPQAEWTGLGSEWLKSWLGAKEWRVPCLDVYMRL